jgi:hypothetical protein
VVSRTLEAFFRHPIQLLLLLIALPLISVAVTYEIVPRTYQAQASLWALQRYAVIGATGPESDLLSTPAQTQAAALSELLQTRDFALKVAQGIPLAQTLDISASVLADPVQLNDALFTELSHNVLVTPQGYNLFQITYNNRSPVVAQKIVQAVITNYSDQSQQLTVAEGQHLLASYQTQLADAQHNADAAAQAEAQYISAHPNIPLNQLANDPEYAYLDAQRLQAQSTLQNIQSEIASINEQISTLSSSNGSLFTVIDSPAIPQRSASRLKQYLLGGGVGLAVSFLACALYLVILIRRDRGVYSGLELRKFTTLPIVMQLPSLSPSAVHLLQLDTQQKLLLPGTNKAEK